MNKANSKAIRLLIAEDNLWVRDGLRVTFEGTDIEIVAEATTSSDAVHLGSCELADVMLLDIRLPEGDGFDVLEKIRSANPKLAILIYSQHERGDFQDRARRLGARGYLNKRATASELSHAVRKASRGESLWNDRANDGQKG